MNKLKLTDSELCEADGTVQTMKHLVEDCLSHHFSGGTKILHALGEGRRRPQAVRIEKRSVNIRIRYYLYQCIVTVIYNKHILQLLSPKS